MQRGNRKGAACGKPVCKDDPTRCLIHYTQHLRTLKPQTSAHELNTPDDYSDTEVLGMGVPAFERIVYIPLVNHWDEDAFIRELDDELVKTSKNM